MFVSRVYWNIAVCLASCQHWCSRQSHNSVWSQVSVALLRNHICSTSTTFFMGTAKCHISCGGTDRNRRRRDDWQFCARRMFQFHKVISPHLARLLSEVYEFSHLTCYAWSRVIVLTDLHSTDEWNPVSASVHSLLTRGSDSNISLRR